jgi:hypothetical protein
MAGMSIVLALALAWGFERAQMIISAPNYGTPANGYGAIDLTMRREIKAPMAYRVLGPLVVTWIERLTRLPRIGIYQDFKLALETLAFWSVGQAFGAPVAMLTAVLLLLTVKYDYWSWAAELAGLSLALTGRLELAIPGVILYALSRETAPLAAAAYYLATFDALGAGAVLFACALTLLGIYGVVGKRELYCARWQWHYNKDLFKNFLDGDFWRMGQWFHQDIFIACSLTVLALVQAATALQWTGLVPLALLGAGWTMAKADETRIFSAALPWVALLILGA